MKIKKLDKKAFILIILIAIVAGSIIITMNLSSKKENKNDIPIDEDSKIEDIQNTENCEVEYKDANADLDYNYIVNPSEINIQEMPATGVLPLLDAVSNEFNLNGIYGTQLSIENVSKKGTYISFDVKDLLGGSIVKCKYDYTENTYEIYTKVN